MTGYASGNVALWDISDEQGLNFVEINNERHVLPANYFYFGERNIKCKSKLNISYGYRQIDIISHYFPDLELHYDSSGANWLAVGSAVRKLVVYDISNWSQPLSIVGDTIHNLFLGDLYWPSMWESLAVGSTELSRTSKLLQYFQKNNNNFNIFFSMFQNLHV